MDENQELDFAFDAEQVDDSREFSVMPEGNYRGLIQKAYFKPTKNGPEALNLQIQIIDDENYSRRVVFAMFLLQHPKQEVRNSAFKSIKALGKSVFGMTTGSVLKLPKKQDYIDSFENKVCFFKTKNEEFNGQINAKVNFFKECPDNDPYVQSNLQLKNETFTPVSKDDDIPF